MKRASRAGLILIALLLPGAIHAAGGTTITPPLQDYVIKDGTNQVSVQLTNNSTGPASFKATTEDFGTLNESGGVIFINPNEHPKYGLAQFLTVPSEELTLAPGQTVTVSVNVASAGISPGGHYGAILFQQVAQEARGNVSTSAVLASLIFAHKIGGETYQLDLRSADMTKSWFHLPTTVQLRFYNGGNIHAIPRGLVRLVDARGRVVAKGVINAGSSIILPESYRQYFTTLGSIDHAALPGQYRLMIDYRYDGSNTTSHFEEQFWYVPVGATVLLGAMLLGLIVGLVVIFKPHRKA